MNDFSIKDCVRFGWETFIKRPWFFIGVNLLLLIISGISSQIATNATTPEWNPTGILISLVDSLVVQVFVLMGMTAFFLKAHDNAEGATFGDTWTPGQYWKFLGSYLLTSIIVAIGFVLLIVPGIILAMVLYFTLFPVVDRGVRPFQALSESARMTKGHRWQLFLFSLVLLGLNILGLLALVVGLLVTIPVSWLAMAHVYRALEKRTASASPVTSAA